MVLSSLPLLAVSIRPSSGCRLCQEDRVWDSSLICEILLALTAAVDVHANNLSVVQLSCGVVFCLQLV